MQPAVRRDLPWRPGRENDGSEGGRSPRNAPASTVHEHTDVRGRRATACPKDAAVASGGEWSPQFRGGVSCPVHPRVRRDTSELGACLPASVDHRASDCPAMNHVPGRSHRAGGTVVDIAARGATRGELAMKRRMGSEVAVSLAPGFSSRAHLPSSGGEGGEDRRPSLRSGPLVCLVPPARLAGCSGYHRAVLPSSGVMETHWMAHVLSSWLGLELRDPPAAAGPLSPLSEGATSGPVLMWLWYNELMIKSPRRSHQNEGDAVIKEREARPVCRPGRGATDRCEGAFSGARLC
jgi:hypothetical protein